MKCLKEIMKDKLNMISGHSGVGKSTLINKLQPNLNIDTKEISTTHKQGQHTTTFSELYDFDFGASIIDTPGIKGFGFIPIDGKNIRTPHVGKVILEDNVEIGANSTIDRGSLGDTIIGKNTFLDNQVHVAHNVKIGKNCMIAGQVGFAGSSTLGDNVVIGGQAGVSGHLNIGNNVKIGGGSGVINDIPSNQQVMGYPAVKLKDFIKQRKK